MIKLFDSDLDGTDPFYIEGHDWVSAKEKEDHGNYYNNFIDTENIDEFDDYQNV